MRLWGFVSAMTGQPLTALTQSLPDPVELLGDGAQPFALMVLALLGGRREQDSFLADETLDPGEELQFLGKLRELLGVRQGGAQGCKCDHEGRHRTRAPRLKAWRRTARRRSAGRLPAAGPPVLGQLGCSRRRCGHPCPMRPRRPTRVAKSAPGRRPFADRNARSVGCGRLTAPLSETPSACLVVDRLPRLEHADLSKRMARHCG